MKIKYLLAATLGLIMSIGQTFAAQYDCGLVADGVDKTFELYKKYITTNIVNEDIVKDSLQHLADYCCKKTRLNTKEACSGVESRAGGAESPYLFDHLVDLSYRRLDAYKDANLRYNNNSDTKGSQRQQALTSFNNPANNTKPEEVIKARSSFRPNQENSSLVPDDLCGVTNVDNVSLYGKYKAACNISLCLAGKVTNALKDSQTSASVADQSTCSIIAQNRYASEASYIKQLLTRVGIRTITNLVEGYTQNYFVGNRRQALHEKFGRLDQNLSFVNRKVQEGTPYCAAK